MSDKGDDVEFDCSDFTPSTGLCDCTTYHEKPGIFQMLIELADSSNATASFSYDA